MKRLLVLGISLFFLLSCKEKSSDTGESDSDIVLEEESGGFPQFQGKDIFFQASLMQATNFDFEKQNWSIKSDKMFGCMAEKYFVEGTEYCFYFDKIWIQSKTSTNQDANVFALSAHAAYSNKIFTDFLFQQSVLSLEKTDFVLYSSVVNWQKDKNLLISPQNSLHLMKNSKGDVLKGTHLILDYRTNMMTMDKADLNVVGDLL